MTSVEEVEKGYYVFESYTGGYTMVYLSSMVRVRKQVNLYITLEKHMIIKQIPKIITYIYIFYYTNIYIFYYTKLLLNRIMQLESGTVNVSFRLTVPVPIILLPFSYVLQLNYPFFWKTRGFSYKINLHPFC